MTTIKELKRDAKVRLSGSYFKLLFMYLLYDIIIYAFLLLNKYIKQPIVILIYSTVVIIFTIPLAFGLISCIIDVVRGKKVPLTEFINVGLKNISKSWSVQFKIILKSIIPIILLVLSTSFAGLVLIHQVTGGPLANYIIIASILFLLSLIFLVIKLLYYSFAYYILKDNPEKTSNEIVNSSYNLLKGNILKYICVGISFIGWYLLIFAICYILAYFLPKELINILSNLGSSLLFPYITTTMVGFYEDVFYDKSHAEEKQ